MRSLPCVILNESTGRRRTWPSAVRTAETEENSFYSKSAIKCPVVNLAAPKQAEPRNTVRPGQDHFFNQKFWEVKFTNPLLLLSHEAVTFLWLLCRKSEASDSSAYQYLMVYIRARGLISQTKPASPWFQSDSGDSGCTCPGAEQEDSRQE